MNKFGNAARSFSFGWKSTKALLDVNCAAEDLDHPDLKLARSTACSSTILTIATRWNNNCVKNHVGCRGINPGEELRGSWNPTRLLDLGENGPSDRVQLIHTDELPDAVPYTALSHCWGTIQHLCLLEENLQDSRRAIPIQQLSKTFRDAVAATLLRLGVRYIWIDSIYIIQNSDEDWRAESSIMGNLYRFCQCCIAATAASDARMGCFVQRDLGPLRIPSERSMRMAGNSIEHPENPGYYECSDLDLWLNEAENSVLSKRA